MTMFPNHCQLNRKERYAGGCKAGVSPSIKDRKNKRDKKDEREKQGKQN